jgi:hypothetical protein
MENNTQVPAVADTKKNLDSKSYKYLLLLIWPAIIGSVGAFIWYLIGNKICVTKKDEGIFENILVIVGGTHGFIAGLQIAYASRRKQKMKQAIKLKNKQMFDEFACDGILEEVRHILAVTSVLIFGIFLFYPFDSIYTGLVSVWIVMFLLYMLWAYANEMSDPYKGVSKITPEEVEEIFGKEEKA